MADIDAGGVIGGVIHGGAAAGAVDRPTGEAGEGRHACADCGTEVVGRFCHQCGQPAHIHRTLTHLGEEVLHGVMHFDSRMWRTLPLLAFRPGRLTREWVHGKRSRYVSPLAIFLFTVFVMFMGLSYMPAKEKAPLPAAQQALVERLAEQIGDVREAEARVLTAKTPEARAEAEAEATAERAQLEKISAQIKAMDVPEDAGFDWKDEIRRRATAGDLDMNLENKALEAKIRHKLENPELALYKLQQAFYKFSFLLIPISIPFVALLFLWKRGFTLYDHGVFVLYSLTFMSMLVMVTAVATRIGGITSALVWMTVPFAVPAHMFFQLKGAYGLGTFSALWRTWFLLWFCAIALGLFVAAVTILSA